MLVIRINVNYLCKQGAQHCRIHLVKYLKLYLCYNRMLPIVSFCFFDACHTHKSKLFLFNSNAG